MPRRTTAPFYIVAGALFVLLVASNMPTPLYAVYRERFGFSSAVLTLIFATYAVVLVPSLLLFGQLSDRLGRRRVIAAGLVVAMAGLALFAAARGTAWLFAARAVQGLSVGAITGAATAGLVELEPGGDRQRAALLSVLAQAGGCAVGPLVVGALARWAPEPRLLCYLVAIVVTAASRSRTSAEDAGPVVRAADLGGELGTPAGVAGGGLEDRGSTAVGAPATSARANASLGRASTSAPRASRAVA